MAEKTGKATAITAPTVLGSLKGNYISKLCKQAYDSHQTMNKR